ncbi:methyltransferase type 11 [Podospora australis]|uniref:Methyltransferase type 11 n=1 Tax=Podospora australis TaxID=1536484 RepID=A0AAN6WVV6_9PEZI|nr:methyltransferase type 11 [Podospora australis]
MSPTGTDNGNVNGEENQYDKIADGYQTFRKVNPATLIEESTLRGAITPFIKPGVTRVLDLACGTGFWSRKVLEWGAESVVGVDLSAEMVSIARKSTSSDQNIVYRTGDAKTLGLVDLFGEPAPAAEEGEFDVVLAVWLLNYAATKEEQRQMFRTVSSNLKKGGVMVGIAPKPTPLGEIDAWAEKVNREGKTIWGVTANCYERADVPEEGWKCEITGEIEGGKTISFKTFMLGQEIYEEAAKLGRMKGRYEWVKPTMVPEGGLEVRNREFWTEYFRTGPHMGVLVVHKD